MQILLFVCFSTCLRHNACHTSLEVVRASVERLIEDEEAELEDGKLPSVTMLKKHLNKHDDYTGYLTNGTWFHIQPKNIFEKIQ